jgi:hypothetical protein
LKTVACPICERRIYSESFIHGERFPCPHCQQEMTVTVEKDVPVVHSTHDLVSAGGWAGGIWREGRLRVSSEKLATLGEFVVGTLGIDGWSTLTADQIADRQARFQKAHRILKEAGIDDEFYLFGRTLLDLFVEARRTERGG